TVPNWIKEMTATWSVPTKPSKQDPNNTDTFLTGLQNNYGRRMGSLLEYRWKDGGYGWVIHSWTCDQNCAVSKNHPAHAGDVIHSAISGANCSSGGACKWTITTKDGSTGQSSTVYFHAQRPQPYAFASVDIYYVTCNELPSSGSFAFNPIHV